jgi:hypothetical protein
MEKVRKKDKTKNPTLEFLILIEKFEGGCQN